MRETRALPLVAGEEELLSTRATSAEPEDGAVLVAESVDDCHSAIHNRESFRNKRRCQPERTLPPKR